MMRRNTLIVLALAIPAITGCRGETSTQPPVHLVQNMDFQEKLKAQSRSQFAGWKDERGMRLPVHGTVPHDVEEPKRQGTLKEHSQDAAVAKFHTYKLADGTHVTANPLPKTLEVLARGKQRYEINCAVCHDHNARGLGIVGRKLNPKPPILVPPAKDDDALTRNEWERIKAHSDGKLFDVITNGWASMRPYRFQVSVKDRWAIIHYLRALQLRATN